MNLSSGRPKRVRINQPSTSQPLHRLHGKLAIAIPEEGPVVDIYFTEGDVHSMRVKKSWLDEIFISNVERTGYKSLYKHFN